MKRNPQVATLNASNETEGTMKSIGAVIVDEKSVHSSIRTRANRVLKSFEKNGVEAKLYAYTVVFAIIDIELKSGIKVRACIGSNYATSTCENVPPVIDEYGVEELHNVLQIVFKYDK